MFDQRLSFIRAVREEGLTISAACILHGISRATGHASLKRFDEEGPSGLADRSKRPHDCPFAVDPRISDQILACKARHPTWGPKKLRAELTSTHPDSQWPALSTFGRILLSAGLVTHSNCRPKPPRIGRLTQAQAANDVWCMDYKGQFRLGNGRLCYPFTATDNQTRYLLRCYGFGSASGMGAWSILVGAFREYGMPKVMRSDNGTPFGAASATGLSRIAVQLLKLGISPERIDPGSPQQNGRHERMHKTLKNEAVIPPQRTMAAQQVRFNEWRREYNEQRPHEALDMQTPSSIYSDSPRRFPVRVPGFEYDENMPTRKVRHNGCIRVGGAEVFISDTLANELIGVEPISDQLSAVYAGFLPVAILSLAKPRPRLLTGRQAQQYLNDLRAQKEALD